MPIARIEMLNKDQMGISIRYSKLKDIEEVPTLFFEFHGSESSNNENIKIVEEISKDNNGSSSLYFDITTNISGIGSNSFDKKTSSRFYYS